MQPYTETQLNKYRWPMTGFLIVFGVAFLTFFINMLSELDLDPLPLMVSSVIGYSIFTGFLCLTLFKQLTIRIDETGVHYQVLFSWMRWQHIPWQEIDRIYVREFALLGEYPRGFMGFRQGPNGFCIAPYYGTFGLQIEKTLGGKYLFATKQPDLLTTYLLNRPTTQPVSPA